MQIRLVLLNLSLKLNIEFLFKCIYHFIYSLALGPYIKTTIDGWHYQLKLPLITGTMK